MTSNLRDSAVVGPTSHCNQRVLPEGYNSDNVFFFFFFFLIMREDPNSTKRGPASAHQRNAIEMAFRWRADDGQTLNAG